jgi:hypothetical protein
MPKAEGRKAAARSGNYQDNVTAPLSREYDYDATADDEIDEIELDDMLPAIERLRKIIKAVRSSPQRRQAWAREIQFTRVEGNNISDDPSTSQRSQRSLMLILDVRTRWASTHQMLRTPFLPPFISFQLIDARAITRLP